MPSPIMAIYFATKAFVLFFTEALAAELNMSVAEVFGLQKATKQQGKKLPPKYINPANPSQTWSGRGKRPNWLVDELNKGKQLEDFRV